ncbi:MAG: N-acetyl-gamma-glutamyl-phosphate reductase [Bacteroidales bacterium]|nr:MAG: N-acetyl-gamma-glutamyl-phosphate reductase [Bacteroidales bacterium]
MSRIRVAIEGGAGYTAGELLRLLINHPNVEIKFVNSESHKGRPVSDVHHDLLGDTNLYFDSIDFTQVDVVFLCKGHGKSLQFMKEIQLPKSIKIIDLSEDFRDGKEGFVYGLPEFNRERIKSTSKLANPGCFATAIELALLPLASSNMLYSNVHITAITGSTGAGQSLSETSHFSWRNNNISIYKPFKHQHLKEIGMCIKNLQPTFKKVINMIPIRGNFSRGILASIYTQCHWDGEYVKSRFIDYYQNHPFIRIVDEMPDLKQVVNTNKCIIYIEKIDDKIYIVSAIDNLLKGASGQAVQNMNLMFGLDEITGLKLKSVGF